MRRHLLICMYLTVLLQAAPLASAPAREYPQSCYSPQELDRIRAWENTWAGRKISSSDTANIREFLPESLYALLSNSSRWGESWFEIVPYRQIQPTPGTIQATKKYQNIARVNGQGEIINWTAGVPFPGTRDGLEIAHNFRCRNYGDNQKALEEGFIIDGKLKYDLRLSIEANVCFFSGRVDMPPVPELPDNSRRIWRAFHMVQNEPPEVRNMRILELHYKERLKSYESWIWMPTIRRMRRRSTSERQDAQGGSDFCGFDNEGWDGPVSLNSYKYLGEKDLLLARHQNSEALTHKYGTCLWNGVQRERVRVIMLEVTNHDPNFLYSKMIWYLDPETWQMLYSDRYDREGRLWKVLEQLGCLAPGYQGVAVNYMAGAQMIDVQRMHATLALAKSKFGVALPENMFTTAYLQKHGY